MSNATQGSISPQEKEVQRRLATSLVEKFGDKIKVTTPLAWKEYGLAVAVKRDEMREVFSRLRDDAPFLFNMLVDLTAVDYLDSRSNRFEVVYQLLSLTHLHRLCVKVAASEEMPEVDSVRFLWPSANFMEREVWDMYGIAFKDHGDLRRILMYDEFVGHPLRKDYPLRGKQPRVPLRIPELRNDSVDMIRGDLVELPTKRKAM